MNFNKIIGILGLMMHRMLLIVFVMMGLEYLTSTELSEFLWYCGIFSAVLSVLANFQIKENDLW